MLKKITEENMSSADFAAWVEENLIGEKLTEVSSERLVTESGWEIKLTPNAGCYCGNGTAALWLEKTPKKFGAITGVKWSTFTDDDDPYNEDLFHLFLYMEGIPAIQFSGDDGYGNGYYGYGFYVSVESIKNTED